MSDDPINISVTDNVSPNVEKKLLGIADAATKGEKNLLALKDALAGIRGDNLATLQAQGKSYTATINEELAATKNLQRTTEQNNAAELKAALAKDRLAKSAAAVAVAEDKAALSAMKLADATARATAKADASAAAADKNAAALKREADAADAASAAASRPIRITTGNGTVAAVNSTLGGTGGSRAEAAAQTAAMSLATGSKQAKAAIVETEVAAASLASKTPGLFNRFKTAGLTAFDAIRDGITGNGTKFLGATEDIAKGGGKAAAAIENLGHKAILSSGSIREILVLAREGSRGDFTRMAGSASILATQLGVLAVALPLAAVGFTALYTARKSFNTDDEKKKLEEYANSLGLTEKEMRKLKNTTVDAKGELQEHNELQITYGDTLKGLWATIRAGLSDTFAGLAEFPPEVKSVSETALGFLSLAFKGFYAMVTTLVEVSGVFAKNLVVGSINALLIMANAGVIAIQATINTVISGLNLAADAVNYISEKAGKGKVLGTIEKVDLGVKGLLQNTMALGSYDVGERFNKNLQTVDRTLTTFGKRWKKETDDAAVDRIKDAANAIIANRNPHKAKVKKDTDPKDKDDYLDDENLKLDNQIKLFGMLKEARDVQQQLNQIEESFAKRRMPLNEAELAQYRTKIELIQRNNRVQAQMDSIYTSINGPQQTFDDGMAALNELLKRHNIDLEHYNIEMDKLKRTYNDAIDPMFALNEAIDNEAKAIGLSGDALDKWNNSERVRQALLGKGIDITKDSGAAYRDAAKDAVGKLNDNTQEKYVTGTVSAITDPLKADRKFLDNKKEFYARIDELRKTDVINEKEAAQAKASLDAKYNEIRFKGAEEFFGNLSGLSASKNKELAAIGKAAAVADATIKGYQAVQNALASIPPPFNIAAAAAMAVTAGVQVANIISTPTDVGSYWTGGDFIVKGKTGVDANRISMAVSDGERVTIQTKAQQESAANDNKNAGPAGDTHVNNFFDEKSFIAAMDSQAGERVVMNIIARRKREVAGMTK
jgi:hypothetical protein